MAPRVSAQLQVLKVATEIKLRELSKHEEKLRKHYEQLLRDTGLLAEQDWPSGPAIAAAGEPVSSLSEEGSETKRKRLSDLYQGLKNLKVVQSTVHGGIHDIERLVDFAQCDPWTTRQVVELRTQEVLREVRQRRSLWHHNKLLGAFLKEALEEEADRGTGEVKRPKADTFPSAEIHDEPLAELTKEETQKRLEGYFFQPSGVDEDAVVQFLETQVFHRRESQREEVWIRHQRVLNRVRQEIHEFESYFLEQTNVTPDEVKDCVHRLLREAAFFSAETVALLKDLEHNSRTQEELAHVLTVEVSLLREFRWPEQGVPVNIQRAMNGRYRCYIQEDLVTLLLFQYVGSKWSELICEQLPRLLTSLDARHRSSVPKDSVEFHRQSLKKAFTMATLQKDVKKRRRDSEDGDGYPGKAGTTKQDLIRLLCTEARLQQVLLYEGSEERSITAVTTDLEFFGPSVSHEAVMACLRFFGVSGELRAIFGEYMKIPLVFPGFDAPKKMVRGVSISRAMSMFLSELILFVMDYFVESSSGVHLFRSHDDILFYDADGSKILVAWDSMQKWAKCAGLRFNEEKSGSALLRWRPRTTNKQTAEVEEEKGLQEGEGSKTRRAGPPPLPPRPIQWGLLELESDASVRINQDKVKAFAVEMADRLRAAKSVFGWISVYNQYMYFFLRNFGNVSLVFGSAHVEEVLQTLHSIHRQVFPKSAGDVMAYLRDVVTRNHSSLLGAEEIPAAWALWPLESGGLGLYNPFLAIWSLKRSLGYSCHESFTTLRESIVNEYLVFKESVETAGLKAVYPNTDSKSWFRFTKSSQISDAERKYGTVIHEFDDSFQLRSLQEYLDIVLFTNESSLASVFKAYVSRVDDVEPDYRSIYNSQVMEEFGTLHFFNEELLPTQLIETIKKRKVSW